jgi:dethiobiotin synthetase
MRKVIFITGIDTGVGKSYATGFIAKKYAAKGYNVITQKFIQTGNKNFSEDIAIHRKIMGIELLPEDIDGTTCPIILSYPASPHLAAQLDNVSIDLNKIQNATNILQQKFNLILIEGAGGIMTPITENYTTINYIKDRQLPVFVVTTPRLGSINHTLLTLEICRYEKIEVVGMVYNNFNIEDNVIGNDTKQFLKNRLKKYFPNSQFLELEFIRLQ